MQTLKIRGIGICLSYVTGLYRVKDAAILTRQEQVRVLEYLEHRFADVLQEGVAPAEAESGCNRIWLCWLQGENAAPDLVKACMRSCKEHAADFDVTVLSAEKMHRYIALPGYIEDKHRVGIISHAQYSDLIRAELLCEYGGIWADATVYWTDSLWESMLSAPFFVFKEIDLTRKGSLPIVASSWFIQSYNKSRIMLLTRKLLHAYWRTAPRLENYFLFHLFFTLATRRYPEEWQMVPTFNNQSPHIMGFELERSFNRERWKDLCAMSPVHKLNHHIDYSGCSDSFYNHIVDNPTD